MGIVQERTKKGGEVKSFFANWVDMEKDVAIVVGVTREQEGNIGKNFIAIAEEIGIMISHEEFMSNIIMLKKEDLVPFIKKCTNL